MTDSSRSDTSLVIKGRKRWLLMLPVLLAVALSTITSIDRVAEIEFDKILHRALVTFALARTLNGVISAVQGTELALQPAGVGVTLTPGQVLDPVNDLIERFSWIMLGATLSLGVQQVLLEIGQTWIIKGLVLVLGVGWLWLRFRRAEAGAPRENRIRSIVLKAFIVMLFIRFAIPATLIANEAIYSLFLEQRYTESTEVIESAGADIERVSARPIVEEEDQDVGVMEMLQQALADTRQSLDLRARVDQIQERATDLVEHLIQLCVVFILQTGLLPIAFLWLTLQLLKRVFRAE